MTLALAPLADRSLAAPARPAWNRSIGERERADLLLPCRGARTSLLGVARLRPRTVDGLWKRNDHGDELLLLAAGRLRIDLLLPDGREQVLDACAGELVFIPQGAAHALTVLGDEAQFVFVAPHGRAAAAVDPWEDGARTA